MIQTITSTGSGCAMMISTGGSNQYGSVGVGFCGNNMIRVYSNSVWFVPTTGKVVNDGLWHTVLVTYDGTTLNIYVDGILDNTATNWNYNENTASIASTLNTVGNSANYLGQWSNPDYRHYWTGKLKNVIFYDYVITNSYALANSYQSAGSVLYTSGNNLVLSLSLYIIYIYIYIYILLYIKNYVFIIMYLLFLHISIIF